MASAIVSDRVGSSPGTGSNERRRRKRIALVCGAAIGAVLASQAANRAGQFVLWNDTPSEPEGLYLRTSRAPAVGQIAAFMAPALAAGYVARHLSYLRHAPILKVLAAGPGSFVCTSSGRLVIDGRIEAPIARHDSHGAPVPRWNGCRRLGPGEWFSYSNRVPNSFDSRYYGPVRSAELIAVYRPLWVGREQAEQ